MRIATYNVWNENKGKGQRFDQLKNEILQANADIVGLQEVTPLFFQTVLKNINYPYLLYFRYPWEEEGLAILSRFPIANSSCLFTANTPESTRAIHAEILVDSVKYSVTNLHLPWDSALQREKQIISIDQYIHHVNADFYVLLGDFNSGLTSSVNGYLTGDQTLFGKESNPCWNELSSAYAARINQPIPSTLDPVHNPRWAGKLAPFAPMIMDRIYVMESWHSVKLSSVNIFGTQISSDTHLSASDHYGVVADISFSK